jgi:glutamyl-tRNA reductase
MLEQLTRSIVNKIMHAPISRLRDETDREAGLIRLEEARALFALDAGPTGSVETDEDDDEGSAEA